MLDRLIYGSTDFTEKKTESNMTHINEIDVADIENHVTPYPTKTYREELDKLTKPEG